MDIQILEFDPGEWGRALFFQAPESASSNLTECYSSLSLTD